MIWCVLVYVVIRGGGIGEWLLYRKVGVRMGFREGRVVLEREYSRDTL